MTKRFGFTLAEVLITLGIIGVVAAMTMPTLMNQTQGAQYKTAYKKALSALSQAVTLNVALDEWNFADATGSSPYTVTELLSSRMNVVRTETDWTKILDSKNKQYAINTTGASAITSGSAEKVKADGTNTTLFFNDGIMFSFPTNSTGCTMADGATPQKCYGFIDVNGVKAPNKVVKCDNSNSSATNCEIKNPTDVYPVVFYDQTILPSTVAAKAVLYSK